MCDSGPFCIHYNDSSDCDEKCKCEHECREHDYWDNSCDECECLEFEESE